MSVLINNPRDLPAEPFAESEPGLRKCHVLVVEDERHIARLLDHVLRKEGYAVNAVHDAEKALEAIAVQPPDAILLDIVLPGMSGLDFLRHIRRQPEFEALVVIVLSGHWFKHDDPTLADAGATAQCPKPIAPSKLIRKLQECGMTPLLRNTRTTDTLRAADPDVSLTDLAPRSAACALLPAASLPGKVPVS